MQQDPVGMLLALAMAPRNQESLRSIVAPMVKNKVPKGIVVMMVLRIFMLMLKKLAVFDDGCGKTK